MISYNIVLYRNVDVKDVTVVVLNEFQNRFYIIKNFGNEYTSDIFLKSKTSLKL